MTEIKLNMENLSKEERMELMKLVKKANHLGKWEPDLGEKYWYISASGSVRSCTNSNDEFTKSLIEMNKIFKTQEEAEFELEKCKVLIQLQNYSDEHGEPIDWSNVNQDKYCLVKSKDCKHLQNYYLTYKIQGAICFSSKEVLKGAIEEIGEQRIIKYLFS